MQCFPVKTNKRCSCPLRGKNKRKLYMNIIHNFLSRKCIWGTNLSLRNVGGKLYEFPSSTQCYNKSNWKENEFPSMMNFPVNGISKMNFSPFREISSKYRHTHSYMQPRYKRTSSQQSVISFAHTANANPNSLVSRSLSLRFSISQNGWKTVNYISVQSSVDHCRPSWKQSHILLLLFCLVLFKCCSREEPLIRKIFLKRKFSIKKYKYSII